ncbi:T9SS type A sorting domain-containing protein [Hymenobacter sp. UV11]|uniref:SBBP repeat-containing protein n=1 Tax=Hymenobacter sp. UV11 TaxID=1849735 RepID=UPI0010607596|nr:SBBP repeat-containing protein [Hymenobacter sp. UV11]TDN39155.1 hypothetical protein A8B98_20465 [Hymenobacter sp. UV11]TFZ62926.1 T9SS type A sorting domain-containing protein [Hymenobacter sp. UV11]
MKQLFTRFLLLAAAFLAAVPASLGQTTSTTVAQAWVARYDGPAGFRAQSYDYGRVVAVDATGNVFVTGTSATGPSDYVTIKYAPGGQQLWVARYDGPAGRQADEPHALVVDAAGNAYVTGNSPDASGRSDWATIKYSPSGEQLWVARYASPNNGDDNAYGLAVDAAGNVFVTGDSNGTDPNGDFLTIKYSPAGQPLWLARFDRPGGGRDFAQALALDATGNVYVTGISYRTAETSSGGDFATVKYSPSGQQLWATLYDGPNGGYDEGRVIAVDAAGNAYVSGFSYLAVNGSNGDYLTVKYSTTGQQLWTARYDGPAGGTDYPVATAVDAAGSVVVTGYSTGSGTGSDYATVKYSATGQRQWLARYNGPANNSDVAHGLALDAEGNAYVTGSSNTTSSNSDYLTVKYAAASGQQVWTASYNGPANNRDDAQSVAVDAAGNVYVTGNSEGTTSTDYATIKYTQTTTTTPPAACNRTLNQPVTATDRFATSASQPFTFTAAQLLANDTDPLGRPLRVASVGQPSIGSLTTNADGSYTYTPTLASRGTFTLTYVVEETGPVIASPGTGHYYEFVSAPGICWSAAKAAAAARTYRGVQGYLATITFAGEKEFLTGRAEGQYWFGASDAAVEGDWRWTTGPEAGTLIWKGNASGYGLAYTNWLPGQPDDYQNQYRPAGEDYGILYGNSGLWNDADDCNTGGTTAGYLVEYGGLEACTPVLYSLGTVSITVSPATTAALVAAAPAATAAGPFTFEAAPNPSDGQFRVRLLAAADGPAQLELLDGQGRRVRSLYSGSLAAGELREVAVAAPGLATGLYVVRLQTGQQVRYLRVTIQ